MAVGLVFLHGVGQRESDEKWRIALDGALGDLGFPDTRTPEVVVVAPNYTHLLSAERPERSPAPPRTQQPKNLRLQRRRDYEFGQARLRRLLGVDDLVDLARGPFHPVPDEAADVITKIATSVDSNLREAGRYMRHEDLRSAIINTVLDSLPVCDELVIVGHSLGSLVAIDLLDHLPVNVSVRRLVTIGSPAGLPIFHENSERLLKEFPYGQVKSWLNVVSPLDAVTAGRGLTFLFAAAHDIRVDLPLLEHGSEAYLRQPKVAMALGEALYGSLSRDVAKPETSVELGLTDSEAQATFALAFAHMTLNEMKRIASDQASLYEHALALVQVAVSESLIQVATEQGRNVSSQILDLESGHAPACPRIWTVDDAIRLLVITATTNLVSPWEIECHKSARAALPLASVGLGFGAQQGSKVSDAITDARNALGLDKEDVWARLLLGAAGVALVVAAPVGLALAVPAGLAGAAAVTSALAAFGPGGMVGGMALAGTLIGTGAVTAASAALADAPQVVLEVEVLRRIAHARARQLLGLDLDPFDWLLLTAMEGRVGGELARLSAFSDGNAVSVKVLKEKAKLIRRAIEWLLGHGLGQSVIEQTAG